MLPAAAAEGANWPQPPAADYKNLQLPAEAGNLCRAHLTVEGVAAGKGCLQRQNAAEIVVVGGRKHSLVAVAAVASWLFQVMADGRNWLMKLQVVVLWG